jgi:hypothetical protein
MKTDYQTFCPQGTSKEERRKLDVGDIFSNSIKCKKCGDIIRSTNRHDMVYCKCGSVFVDGGSWYSRCGGDLDLIEDMTVPYNDV